jgi:hypothetical protein
MATKALFIDRQIVLERQQHGRNDPCGHESGMTGHENLLIARAGDGCPAHAPNAES